MRDQLEAMASIPMLFEYEAVLMHPEQRQATGMSVEDVGFFLDGLTVLLLPVMPWLPWRLLLRDPDDEMGLDAAVNGRADAIVTLNVQDFLPEARQFQLEVWTPREALRRLRSA